MQRVKNKSIAKYLLSAFVVVVFLNIKPTLFDEFSKLPIWTTRNYYHSIQGLDPSYLELSAYIRNEDTDSRYLTLPLNGGNVIAIQDSASQNNYYVGVSPLLIMTGENDYSGLLSFGPYTTEMQNLILDEEYEDVGRLLQKMNVSHIITNENLPEELMKSYLYRDSYLNPRDEEIRAVLFGDHIQSFGDYSLYRISPTYRNEKVYITDDLSTFPADFGQVSYHKVNESKYEVTVNNVTENMYLVFLEPYYNEWELHWPDGKVLKSGNHDTVYGYANAWQLTSDDLSKGTTFEIYFKPYDYYNTSLIVSTLFMILLTGYSVGGYIYTKKTS
jgi:hypothetical protein